MAGELFRYGVIDVGSNTIRAAVYEVSGCGFRVLADQRDFSNLLAHTIEGTLSETGIACLCRVLSEMKAFCDSFGCRRIDCFATASLRGVSNFEEVHLRAASVGVNLQLLSGEEEALCDYAGLMQGKRAEAGAGFDLGGGSCQLFRFESQGLQAYGSFPIGVSAMKRHFSPGCGLGQEDAAALRACVLSQLSRCPKLHGPPLPFFYAMGGTARAAYRAFQLLGGGLQPDGEESLTLEEMQRFFQLLALPEGRAAVCEVDADRLPTIGSGLVVMMTICEFMDAPGVVIARCGVREGYLWRNIIQQGRQSSLRS